MMVMVSLTHKMEPIDLYCLPPVYNYIVVQDPVINRCRCGILIIDLIHQIFVPVLIQDFRGNYFFLFALMTAKRIP